MTATGARFVALLRGVNVGGKNPLPMRELASALAAADLEDVETYIQSGNVVFGAAASRRARLSREIAGVIAERFSLDVPVVVRSAGELEACVARNPFLAEGAPESALHVAFLADAPTASAIAKLDPSRSPPDRVAIVGADAYLFLPNGMARTKITNAYLDRALSTISTARNWRTVRTLRDMAHRAAPARGARR